MDDDSCLSVSDVQRLQLHVLCSLLHPHLLPSNHLGPLFWCFSWFWTHRLRSGSDGAALVVGLSVGCLLL